MATADGGSASEMTPEVRRRVGDMMSLAVARELEEEFRRLTPQQVDENLFQAQLKYKDLSKGQPERSLDPAVHAWEDHILEHGPSLFPEDPYDTPYGYTYQMALGLGEFRRRWGSSRSFLGLALGRVYEEAGRLGLIDSPAAVDDLRRRVVEEVTATGSRNIVKAIAESKFHDEPAPVAEPPVVMHQAIPDLQYGSEDVRAESHDKLIDKLRKPDLIRIFDANELPEFCEVIHIMRLLGCTRSAIYNANSRMTKLIMKRYPREVPLGEWVIPKPIEAKGRHMRWSKSEVIRWKAEREQWEQSPRKKRGKS
jgi:predicted DNA-binding transcriptional regulator AlpA